MNGVADSRRIFIRWEAVRRYRSRGRYEHDGHCVRIFNTHNEYRLWGEFIMYKNFSSGKGLITWRPLAQNYLVNTVRYENLSPTEIFLRAQPRKGLKLHKLSPVSQEIRPPSSHLKIQ